MIDQARFEQVFTVKDESSSGLAAMQAGGDRLIRTFRTAAQAVGGLFAIQGMRGFVSESMRSFGEIRRLSMEMGSTAAAADTLSDAFTQAGLGAGELSQATGRWAMTMAALRRAGPGELAAELQTWAKLGPEAAKSFPEALARAAGMIGAARSEQEKLVIATELFGRQGKALIPILSEGEAKIRSMSSGEGAFFDDAKVARAHAFKVKMDEAADRLGDAKNAVVLAMMPAIEKIAETGLPLIEKGAKVLEVTFGLISDHAEAFAIAVKAAAVYWAGMKAADLLGGGAAGGAAAAAAAAGGGGLSFANLGAYRDQGLRSTAAGPNSVLPGAYAPVSRGTRAMSGLRAAGRAAMGAAKYLPVVGTAAMIAGDLWDMMEGGESRPASTTWRQDAQKIQGQIQAAKDAVEAKKAEERHTRDVIDPLKRFAQITGYSADKLKELGISGAATAAAMRKGGQAMAQAVLDARNTELRAEVKAGEARAPTDEMVAHAAELAAKQAGKGTGLARVAYFAEQNAERAAEQIQLAKSRYSPQFEGDNQYRQQAIDTMEFARQAHLQVALEAKKAMQQQQRERLSEAIRGADVKINVGAGAIVVHQQFSDSDSDRVIFTMMKDLMRLADKPLSAALVPSPHVGPP